MSEEGRPPPDPAEESPADRNARIEAFLKSHGIDPTQVLTGQASAPTSAVDPTDSPSLWPLMTGAPVSPRRQGRGEVTVVESLYHQIDGKQPWAVQDSFSTRVRTEEQPYVRHTKVGEEWVAVDRGWVAAASMMLVRNDEGRQLLGRGGDLPAQLAERVVEVGVSLPPIDSETGEPAADQDGPRTMHSPEIVKVRPQVVLVVHPGQSFRGVPADLGRVVLRCRRGEARITIVLTPE